MPKVSILVAVYNAELYLKECIESLRNQSWQDFEIICIDDGSSDRSLEILRHFERQDQRIRIFSRKNEGIARTRNELITLARGRYIAVMDHDDICLPLRLERQIDFLDNKKDIIAVGTSFIEIDEVGRKINPVCNPTSHRDIESALLRGQCLIHHPTTMVRAEVLSEVGGYREGFNGAEDYDLWLRLSEKGSLANIDEFHLYYRIHDNAVSERAGVEQLNSMIRARDDAWIRRNLNATYEPIKHWRAQSNFASKYSFSLKYGWIAWNNGYRDTWFAYALKSVRMSPLSLESWKLLIFGLLRRPRGQGDNKLDGSINTNP